MIDIEKSLVNCIQDGIREGVKQKLTNGYNSPLEKLLMECLSKHDAAFRTLLGESIGSAIGDPKFREEIRAGVRHTLAKTLISRFGGELEKQVNVLKSDPLTRARITVAIEEIVKERSTATA